LAVERCETAGDDEFAVCLNSNVRDEIAGDDVDAVTRVEGGIHLAAGENARETVALRPVVAGEITANDSLVVGLNHERVHLALRVRSRMFARLGADQAAVDRGNQIQAEVRIVELVHRTGGWIIVIMHYGHRGFTNGAYGDGGSIHHVIKIDAEVFIEFRQGIVVDGKGDRLRIKIVRSPIERSVVRAAREINGGAAKDVSICSVYGRGIIRTRL